MPVSGSPLDLSDEELAANADVSPERDLPLARDWKEKHLPAPLGNLLEAREDPNDPATPEQETRPDGGPE